MKPVLFSIGPVGVYSYGVFLVVALLFGLFVMWRLYKNNLSFLRFNLTVDNFFDSVLIFFVAFAAGARLLHVIENFDFFGTNVLRYLLFLHFPGFSFLGGIIGGVIGLWIYCKVQKKPYYMLLDLMAVGLTLALAFSRLGSLLNGDAYGKETSFFLKVEIAGLTGYRHPTQLYEAIIAFCIFALLYFFYNRGRFRNGELFLLFLALIGVYRVFIEFLRGDSVYLGSLAVAQIISTLFVMSAIVVFTTTRREAIRKKLSGAFRK